MAQVALMTEKPPTLEIFVSEVPCMSCLGAMIQFYHKCPEVKLRVSFDRGRQCPKDTNVPYFMLPSTLANRVAFAEVSQGTAPKDSIVKGTLTLQEVMDGAHKTYMKKAEAQVAAKSSDSAPSMTVHRIDPSTDTSGKNQDQAQYHPHFQHHYNKNSNGHVDSSTSTSTSNGSTINGGNAASYRSGNGTLESSTPLRTSPFQGESDTTNAREDRFRAFYPNNKQNSGKAHMEGFTRFSTPASSSNNYSTSTQRNVSLSKHTAADLAAEQPLQSLTNSSPLHLHTTQNPTFLPRMSGHLEGSRFGSRNEDSVKSMNNSLIVDDHAVREDELDFGSFKPARQQPHMHAEQVTLSFYPTKALCQSHNSTIKDFSLPRCSNVEQQDPAMTSIFPLSSAFPVKSVQKQSFYPQFKVALK